MLFQESALFDSMTIAQNVAYPLLNQKSIKCRARRWKPRCGIRCGSSNWSNAWTSIPANFPAACGGVSQSPARWSPNRRCCSTIRPPRASTRSPPTPSWRCIIKERDVDNTTALVVTHRYQDGNLVANFRYNPEQWPAGSGRRNGTTNTMFMVLRRRLVFEGNQDGTGGLDRSIHNKVREASGKSDARIGTMASQKKVHWAQLRVGIVARRGDGHRGRADFPAHRPKQHFRGRIRASDLYGRFGRHGRERAGAAQRHPRRPYRKRPALRLARPQADGRDST